MERPSKCFTCGKNIEKYWDDFYNTLDFILNKMEEKGFERNDDAIISVAIADALDMHSIPRMCCRRMFYGDTPELRKLTKLYKK